VWRPWKDVSVRMQRVTGRATRAAPDEMLIQTSQKAWIADDSPALPEDQDTRRMFGRRAKERWEKRTGRGGCLGKAEGLAGVPAFASKKRSCRSR
jgi:hypothetical protein